MRLANDMASGGSKAVESGCQLKEAAELLRAAITILAEERNFVAAAHATLALDSLALDFPGV